MAAPSAVGSEMAMVGSSKAWTVAVQTVCPHGTRLCTMFVLHETTAGALGRGVQTAIELHGDPECPTAVVGTAISSVSEEMLARAYRQGAELQ